MIQPAVSPSRRVTILKIADVDPRDGLPLFLSHSVELPGQDPATQPVPDMINLPPGIPISTFRVTTDPSDGQSVILSRTVEVTGHAPNSVVDASNSTTGQPSGSVVKARETHDDNQTMVRMIFKTALKEFVTKQIEETRDQGQSKKELRDLIVQKTVDKIMRSVKNIPSTEEMIGKYLSSYKGKIKKLIQVVHIILPIHSFFNVSEKSLKWIFMYLCFVACRNTLYTRKKLFSEICWAKNINMGA